MEMGIRGRKALVCGASKGLGLSCAEALAREGVAVTIVARGDGALQEAAERMRRDPAVPAGTAIVAVSADITSEAGRAKVLSAGIDFDILVTNAGGPPPGDFRDWSRDDWLKAIDANMLAPIELIKATIDGMAARGFGRVVNITSSAVKAPISILGLSNGARSGLTGFVAGLARMPRYIGGNVTVNNLLPGPFETDRLRQTIAAGAERGGRSVAEETRLRREAHPARRFGQPAEFGAACAFLCSAHAGYITGQNLLIDGGGYPGTF